MRKTLLLITILFISAASFALSDMVSVDFVDGSRTVPIEDMKDMYYSNTKDSFYLALEDTTYAFLADSSLHVTFLDSIEGQQKREREALIAIYKALDGDNWRNNENWCSDKPLDEWAGVFVENGFVSTLRFDCLITYDENSDFTTIPQDIYDLLYIKEIATDRLTLNFTPEIAKLKNLYALGNIKLPPNISVPEEISQCKNLELVNFIGSGQLIPKNLFLCKNLVSLTLDNFSGQIPNEVGHLLNLRELIWYGVSGEIPFNIGNLSNLEYLILSGDLTGEIPVSIENLSKLRSVMITGSSIKGKIPTGLFLKPLDGLDLSYNNLSGTIPIELCHMMEHKTETAVYTDIKLLGNSLSGDVPLEVQNHPNWYRYWQSVVLNNHYNLKNLYLPGPQFQGVDIDGDSIYSEDVYPKNKYTILWSIASEKAWGTGFNWNATVMTQFYEKYKNYGIDILYAADEWNTIEEIEALREEYNIQFRCFNTNRSAENRLIINQNRQCKFLQYYLTPERILGNSVMVVDSTGNTIFMSTIDGYETELDQFLYRNLCKDSIDYYVSTDYSQHMLVDTLQMATVGKGIDIVLMGDAYSDRQIADSTYHKDMQYLYENLFTEEPYKSYKEMFNVFTVNVVSPTEGYEHGSTALGGFFGYETEVGGNDGAVIEYASMAVEYEKLDNAVVIVAMNSDKYAGTCYMYYPAYNNNNYGTGLSISYFPKGGDATTFAQLLHHEALGHGFAKLADEYAYEEYGAVPESTVALHQEQQTNWGWWKNIDFTNDSSEVRWSRLLLDERYQYDGLGAFEGGLTYWTGVWRPTENSIMRYNTGGFNAPSREAIYYRIHKLAYGDEWEYDYEKFVEWDAKNRKKADSPLLMPSREAIRNFVPTHPPVIKQMNWREALESEQTPQRGQIKAIEGAPVYDKSINQLPNTNKYVFTTYSNDEQ